MFCDLSTLQLHRPIHRTDAGSPLVARRSECHYFAVCSMVHMSEFDAALPFDQRGFPDHLPDASDHNLDALMNRLSLAE